MKIIFIYFTKTFLIFSLVFVFVSHKAYGDDTKVILQQLQTLHKDIKTLEKAVYSSSSLTQSSDSLNNSNEDALTRHLLKLTEIEEQFQNLTNKFEEINFKLDKLSKRISKIQSDNQMRFQDLEKGKFSGDSGQAMAKPKKLPGADEPQGLGSISESEVSSLQKVQETKSIDATGSVNKIY